MTKQFLTLILSATILTGCAEYPYGYDVYVEDEYVYEVSGPTVSVHDCFVCDEALDISLTWHESPDTNLDLELLTPHHYLVTPADGTLEGCFHLGDDFGAYGSGTEEIACTNPAWGPYEARVINLSDEYVLAELSIFSGGANFSDFSRELWIEPWGMEYVGFDFGH